MPTTGTTELTDLRQRLAADSRVGLLVSVRSADEAAKALAGGADVIDIKEPSNGPLGAASSETLCDVIARVSRQAPVTAALGELDDWNAKKVLPPGLAAVKVGFAGTDSCWRERFGQLSQQLEGTTQLIPVGYADHHEAHSPELGDVLEAAISLKAGWMVIDTWNKHGPTSLERCGADSLTRLIDRARASQVAIVLAGGLSRAGVPAARACRPSLIGVRGAACDGGRTGAISVGRVQSLVAALAPGLPQTLEAS